MDMDEVGDVIDEATIKKVMEDVGLRTPSPNEDNPQAVLNGDDESQHEEEPPCLEAHVDSDDEDEEDEDDDDEELPELEDTEGDVGAVNQTCMKNASGKEESISDGEQQEDLHGQNDKGDQNQNSKLQGTPAALRRSSRTKLLTSPGPNETPSTVGRTTRSQINPEIIAKQKSFMHKYQMAVKSSMDSYVRSATSEIETKVEQQAIKRKWEDTGGSDLVQSPHTSPVLEKKAKKPMTIITPSTRVSNFPIESQTKTTFRHDTYCWTCHTDGQVLECLQCPRVFHQRCVQLQSPIPPKWVCTECISVRNAEKHSRIDIDQLPVMLNFAMERIKSVADAQPFFKPVDTEEFPHYTEYVVRPVDISKLEDKISQGLFTSTREFLADFRWILHNCIIFNSFHSKLTSTARTLMKVCKHEMAEIDTCADCYVHAHTKRETWFLEPCRRPHLLLWAKLKGFPHWPAKAMKANQEGNVDVRFFGAHDRAWVPAKDCFLYSREMPLPIKIKGKVNLLASIEEVDQHIIKLVERYGPITYPSPRTSYNPQKEDEQLQLLIPGYKVTDDSPTKLGQIGDCAETESMQSDSDGGEATDNDPNPKANVPDGDRSEGRNFLAMLQLAPRSSADTATPTDVTPTSTPPSPTPSLNVTPVVVDTKTTTIPVPSATVKLPSKTSKAGKAPNQKANSGETVNDVTNNNPAAPINDSKNNESSCEIVKVTKNRIASSPRRSSTSKDVPIKLEPIDNEEDDDSCSLTGSKACSISLSIDNVVGNYKPTTAIKPKIEPTTKSASKAGTKSAAAKLSGVKSSTLKSTPKSSKPTSNRSTGAKTVPASKTNAKSVSTNRRLVGEEEEDLDPAMYLDPTITITLINNDEKKTKGNQSVNEMANSISNSDLQALNALGENVSITVVPKRKAGTAAGGSARSKENEAVEQPMVIEVDPVALQKTRNPAQTAKARKSFPKTRPVGHSGQQKASQKNAVPPMVSIPSRHFGMEIARPTSVSQQSSSRIPSITVRPVTQLSASQPSIILQPGSSDVTPISAITAALKQPTSTSTTTSSNSTNNSTLTLNTMHTLGPDSAFGTGGLLLTFNRSVPTFASATGTNSSSTSTSTLTAQSKSDCGPLTAQLVSRTQEIADMIRNTLETLMQEMSSAGNLEATIVKLQLDLERCRSQHQQEIAEMKKLLENQQTNSETEKQRALSELRRQLEADKQRAIDEIKKKQWCAHCSQEAIFYCCWNTAYCDYPCQQSHWPKHMATCANANQNTEAETAEAEACSSPAESPIKTPSPQKSIPTVNGSPNQGKKATSMAKTNLPPSPNELGITVLTSSDMSVSLATSPSNAVAVRVGQAIPEAQSIIPAVAPITLLVSTPVPPQTELVQPVLTSSVALPLTTVQCGKALETNEASE